MPGTPASPWPSRRGMLSASSKLGASVGTQILLEILTGMTTSMIPCGMLLPLLASGAPRPDGLIEGLSPLELRLSEILLGFPFSIYCACASFTRH